MTRWSADWDRLWTPEIRRLDLSQADDVQATITELRATFDGASIYPDFSEPLTDAAERRFARGDLAGANEVCEAAIALYPRAELARVYSGVIHLAQGDHDAARERLAAASAVSDRGPAGPWGLNGLAYELRGMGQTALGLEVLRLAIELYPEEANLYDSAGEFQLALGDRARAIELYEQALEVDPEFAHAREVLEGMKAAE